MPHDYVDFGFDKADVIAAVRYELQEFDPVRTNPSGHTKIIHIHRFPAEVDTHYDGLLADELARGQQDDRFPLAPARIVADTRAALGRDDIVLVDTGALKMWMARLYPTYAPNTCLISNGPSTMAWTVPGAIGAKIARPDAKLLVATGDGVFLMNSQEIETALRLKLSIVILIWVDNAYGLISWKMDLELGKSLDTAFGNPDFVAYAESCGARGYQITAAHELQPTWAVCRVRPAQAIRRRASSTTLRWRGRRGRPLKRSRSGSVVDPMNPD